jgi:hypothetical protein
MELLNIGGQDVKQDQNELICLTDLWKASGLGYNYKPAHWRNKDGKNFIETVSNKLKVAHGNLLRSETGRNGGTYAHWQIALAYAKYLSPKLHMEVNEIFMRAKKGDVTLSEEIADKASPEDQEWLKKRMDVKVARNHLTGTLKAHGVTRHGYPLCTDVINKGLFGQSAKEIQAERGVKRTRDAMNSEELTCIQLVEITAARKIKEQKAKGDFECAKVCDDVAVRIKEAIS